ncbi:hypothetical protein niasHT_038851 [Heterodera trifolii]|uniref:MATH domain-containing protein n=1 Tax=Heterodera trifolii TaxID=157864 RepID=A0ABD2IX57_9BILA
MFTSPNKNIDIKELLDPSKGFYNKEEDKVKLAIDVIVDAPKTEKFDSDPNKSNGTLSMEIEKLSEFAREINESERKSETLYIKGMPWKIEAQILKKNESTEKWLGFYLFCDSSEEDGNWSRKCSATLRIVSQKSDVEDLKKELDETVFNNEYPNWGFAFIDFAELMDPSKGLYNKDEDKVTLAIDFTFNFLLLSLAINALRQQRINLKNGPLYCAGCHALGNHVISNCPMDKERFLAASEDAAHQAEDCVFFGRCQFCKLRGHKPKDWEHLAMASAGKKHTFLLGHRRFGLRTYKEEHGVSFASAWKVYGKLC